MKTPTRKQQDRAVQVKSAIDKADLAELHQLYKDSENDFNAIAQAMSALCDHYAGENKIPRIQDSPDAIAAMKDVSIAAISLAETVIKTVKSGCND